MTEEEIELLAKTLIELIKPEIRRILNKKFEELRHELLLEIDKTQRETMRAIWEAKRDLVRVRLDMAEMRAIYWNEHIYHFRPSFKLRAPVVPWKIRTLEETLSFANESAIFDREVAIPHWKKL